MPRFAAVYAVGILAIAGFMTGSQATAASGPADQQMLGTGRHGHTVQATVRFSGASEGATSQMLLVGVPGSTDEIDDPQYLPRSAVLLPANQVPSQLTIGTSSLVATFSPAHAGSYPIFLMSADDPMCHSAKMMADAALTFSLNKVGSVQVS